MEDVDPKTGEIHGMSDSPGGPGRKRSASGSGNGTNSRSTQPQGGGDAERITTLTLASIDPAYRPNPHTVCEVCPAAVWMATPHDVKCFCRLMHYWSWETSKPTELTHCDGLAIAAEREENG
jgi:hypothetical protein